MSGYALYRLLDGRLVRGCSDLAGRRAVLAALEGRAPAGSTIVAIVILDDVATPLMLVS